MTDLVEWLRAALDDVERATIRYRDGHEGPCVNFEGQDPSGYDEYESCARHIATAEATPYRDAAFGLREVAAKRAIVAEHDLAYDNLKRHPDDLATKGWLLGTIRAMRLLAAVYADRPGYDPAWAPEAT